MSDDLEREVTHQFWKALADSPILMVRRDGSGEHALPMTAQLDEALGPQRGGAIWFFTVTDNRLAAGGPAMAQFAARDHDLFACISGRLVEEKDPGVIDRFWSSGVAAWYEQGRSDPKLLMLRFDLDDMEIWTADMSIKGRFRLLFGRKVDPEDAGAHIRTHA